MTPRNAAIVRANPELFAPLVRWMSTFPRDDATNCGCIICLKFECSRRNIDPDRLVELCSTPDMKERADG